MGNEKTKISARECRACKRFLPETDYYKYNGRYQTKCKKCKNKASNAWIKANRARVNARRREKAQNDGWAPQTKWTAQERRVLYLKYAARNKTALKKWLNESNCCACGSASAKLVASYEGTSLSALTVRSQDSFIFLMQNAEVLCKTCRLRERRETWERQYDPDELRTCRSCREEKPTKAFVQTANPKHIKTCRACQKQRSKEYREQKSAECRAYVESLKLKPCFDCGNCFDPIAMDFDHLPQYEKTASVSRLVSQGRMRALQAELAKCELVCSNCHRVRTLSRAQSSSEP